MGVLELIFVGISAFSALATSWVNVATRREALGKGAAKADQGLSRPSWPRSRGLLLAFASTAAAAVAIYMAVDALGEDREINEAPLLRAVIPTTFGKDCVAEEPPARALAGMACSPSRRIPDVHYALFPDRAAMNSALNAEVGEQGLPEGDCETNGFAVSSYGTAGEGNWGRILCYVDDEGSHISWTNEDLRILASAVASADADNELYEWWRYEGGPLPTSNLKSFPMKSEEALLEWMPADHRGDCSRSSWGGRSAKASVVCSSDGVDAVGYASYESTAEMRKAHESRLGRASEDQEPACTARTWEGDSSYSVNGRRVGRLVCYVSDGTGYYEWTYDDAFVAAYARRDDGNMARLFGWWRRIDFRD